MSDWSKHRVAHFRDAGVDVDQHNERRADKRNSVEDFEAG